MSDLIYLRKYRLFGVTLFDFLGSFLVVFILSCVLKIKKIIYLLIIPVSILIHLLFNIKTTLTTKISEPDFNLYKLGVFINVIALIYENLI